MEQATQELTIEDIKLIPIFMGLDEIPPRHYNEMAPHLQYYGHMDRFGTVNGLMSENDLKYNTSWEWMMPVVEKIEALHNEVIDKVYIDINGKCCAIYAYIDFVEMPKISCYEITECEFKVQCHSKNNKLQATFQAVIDFIKWYNIVMAGIAETNKK